MPHVPTGTYKSASLKNFPEPSHTRTTLPVRRNEPRKNLNMLQNRNYPHQQERKIQSKPVASSKSNNLRVSNRFGSNSNKNNEPKDLSDLASYLLKLKSSASREDVNVKGDAELPEKHRKLSGSSQEHQKLSIISKKHEPSPARSHMTESSKPAVDIESITLDNIVSVSDTAVVIEYPEEESVDKRHNANNNDVSISESAIQNESMSTHKSKKIKIQLSQYACGRVNEDASTGNPVCEESVVVTTSSSQERNNSEKSLCEIINESSTLLTTLPLKPVDDKSISISNKVIYFS